jgi:hypothetical protein
VSSMKAKQKISSKRKLSFLSLILCFSLVLSSVSTLFVQPAEAKSSRIAKIEQVSGTVFVKKAGGSKELRAYRNMTLNHGDHISTEARSSVVLQIVDRKDEVTIGEKSNLYISSLLDEKGNKKTNFSMWGGSMWVKASSLIDSEDEFEIETPTSIMGVRGTNFFAGVDPVTRDSSFFIASGVGAVNNKKNKRNQSNPTLIYPLQQININDDTPSNTMDEMVTIVDIDSLVNLTDQSIIEAIIKNKQSMDQENEEYIKKLNQQNDTGSQTSSRSEVDRLSRNLDNLVGNIVNTAIYKNKVNEDNINELINQINQQTEKKLDLNNVKPLELTEAERRKQEQIKLMEEQRKQKQEQERQKQEELKKQNEELLKKLQEQKQKQQQTNAEAEKKAKELAEKKYLEKLTELQKQKFEEERRKLREANQGAAPAPTPTTPASEEVYVPEIITVGSITVTAEDNVTTAVYGGTLQMSAITTPVNATNSSVTWSIESGTGTATISSTGLLTGTGVGTVTVKATANDGSGVTGTQIIEVVALVTSATISPETYEYEVFIEEGGGDMAASIEWNDASSIEHISYTINGEGDYFIEGIVEGNQLIIPGWYFEEMYQTPLLPGDTLVFTINFDVGEPAIFTVTVISSLL